MTLLSTLSEAEKSKVEEKLSATSRPQRLYYPAWKKLRKEGKVTLSVVDAAFLSRIKRMISKEKDMDIGFKLLNDVEKPRLVFTWDSEKLELEIKLVGKYNIMDLRG